MGGASEPGGPAVGVVLEHQEKNKTNDKEEEGDNGGSYWYTDQLGLRERERERTERERERERGRENREKKSLVLKTISSKNPPPLPTLLRPRSSLSLMFPKSHY